MKKSILTLITVLLAGLSTAWGQGITSGEELQSAINAASDGATITLTQDITASSTITINKSVTIDGAGYTVTNSAGVAFELTGSNDVTFTNLSINADNASGRAIQAGNDTENYSGNLTVRNSTLTAGQRGVSIYKPGGNINLDISSTTIQSTVLYPTSEYNPNDSRGVDLWSYDGQSHNVTIDFTTIKGFSYCVNVGGTGTISNLTMDDGATYGRAVINNHGKNGTFNLNHVGIIGLNNQTGPTEAFACIVDDTDAADNIYNVKQCTIVSNISGNASSAVGSSATEYLVDLRGTGSDIFITDGTTYSTNDPERGGLIQYYSRLDTHKGNTINFDAGTYSTFDAMCDFANVPGLNTTGNSLTYTAEVYYYWSIGENQYQGTYCSFADVFNPSTLSNGGFIKLQRDVTLSSDVTCPLTDGNSFYLELNGNSITRDANAVTPTYIYIDKGVSVYTDVEIDDLLFGLNGYGIVKTANDDATYKYKYTAVEGVAHINGTVYSTLAAAINAAQDGETILLLSDIGSYDSDANPTYTTEDMSTADSRFNYWINKSITIDGGDNNYSIYVKGRGFGIQGSSANSKIDVTFKNVIVSNVGDVNGRCIDTRGNLNSLTLDNVYLTTNESSYTSYLQPLTIGGNQSSTATVTINNSGITTVDEANKGYAITTFNPVNMTITDSEIRGWACLNIKGADSSAGSKGSTITVDGGSMISANGTPGYSNAFSLIKIEDDKVNVSVTNCEINVNGGDNTQSIVSFQKPNLTSSENSHVSLGVGNEVKLEGKYKFESNAGTSSGLEVSGGKFNVRVPADVIAEGLICPTEANEDNGTMWSLVQGTYVAMIGEYGYETLPAAFAAVQDGETIKLLADITLTTNLTWAKTDASFSLKLQNYTLTKGEYSIALKVGAVVNTDKEVDVFTPFEDGLIIVKRTTADGFSYTCESSAAPSTDVVAQIGDQGYTTLKDALDVVKDGETIKLLKNVNLGTAGEGSPTGGSFTCPLTAGTINIDYNGKTISTPYHKVNFHTGVAVKTNITSRPSTPYFGAVTGSAIVTSVDNGYLKFTAAPLNTVPYVDENGDSQTATNAIALTESLGTSVYLDSYTYYAGADEVTFSGSLTFTDASEAKLILVDGTKLTSKLLNGNNDSKGIVTIYGQSGQTGEYTATGDPDFSMRLLSYVQNGGIVNSLKSANIKNITINNGTLVASSMSSSRGALGRISGSDDFSSSYVKINGGKVTANNNNGWGILTGNVTITGGQTTAKGNASKAGIQATTITMGLQEPEDYSYNDGFIEVSSYNGAVTINGILYDEYTDKDFSGAIANNDDLKNTKLIVGRTVAVIGDQRFHTLQAAINAISNDGMPRTIQLVNDINGENTIAKQKQIVIAESNKKITIDLNGHKILADETEPFKVTGNNVDLTFTGTGEIINADNGYVGVAMRGENGHLTINGGVTLTEATVFVRGKNNVVDVNGKVNVTGEQAAIQTNGQDTNTGNVINVNDPAEVTSATDNAIYAAGDANYNINGGKVTGATAIYQKGGKLTVTDGTITGNGEKKPFEHNDNGANPTGDAIVVENCNYPAGIPEVAIKGGTIISDNASPVASYFTEGYDPVKGFISAGTYNKNNVEADLLAQGYVMQPDGNGMYTPVPGAGVAKIGDVYYATLDAAIAAVPTTGVETKIELLTNINATKRTVIPSNTNIVLDLGGYTLRCDDDFTISDFEGNAGEETSVTSNAKLTIQNGTVTSKEKYAIRLGGNGNTVTIAEDAVIKAGANTDYAVVLRGENNTFEINGTVEVAHGTAVSTNGKDADKNNAIVINEPAKISSPDDNAIYMPSGSLTVNGGTITGKTGIYFKGKTLTIPATSTAVITGNGEQRPANYNGNGGDWTGDAVVVDNANYPSGDPVANIAGGTFVSTNAMPIATYATGSGATLVTKFVSGGKFSEQIPVAVIADGYICPSEPEEGSSYYMLKTGSYEAEVDGMGYETFAKAVEAADEGDVITLLNDVAEPYTMQEGQTLKVAKNGKTITMQTPSGNYQIDEKTVGDVTTYILRKSMKLLTFPTNIESYFTGEAQDVPLVITDGDYTLVPGVDYVFIEGDNTTNDFKKTNVGKYTFQAKGIGKYFSRQTVNWTILKSLNYKTITITINPAIYNGSQKDPKDFITVKDGNTTLVAGTDYKIVTKGGPFTDAKAYIDAVSIIGLKAADKFIGDTIVTDFIINPMDVKDYSVSVSVLYRSEGYTVDSTQDPKVDEVKTAPSYVLTFKDMSGNTVDVANYDVTIADGFYRDVQRYDYTVIVTPTGDNTNVTGRLVGPLYINPGDAIDISQCLVTSKAVYNSISQAPSKGRLEITYTNPTTQVKRILVKDQDYELSFQGQASDYVNAKTYSNAVTLKGIGDFYGELTTDYVIEPRDLSDKYVRADVMDPLQWTGQVQKLNVNHQVSGRNDNNVNLYLIYDGSVNVNVTPNEVVDNGHYTLLTANNDYVLTTVPADIKEPGEYQVTFSGRYNFKGQKTIKVMLLKDISTLTDEDVQVPLQIIKGSLYPSNMQDVVVKDGDKELERGTHYSLKIRYADGTTECTNGNTNPVTQDGVYTAVFTGLKPYYNNTKEVEFIAAYEYYAAGNQQIDHNDAGIHLTSGKDLEAQIGAKTGIAVDATKIGVTIYNQVTLTVPDGADGREVKLSVVGIDDNAFAGENNLHYVDASELADYVPSSLSRTSDSPFNGIAKQALVFLNGYNIHGENYVYKVADNDFRCEELKIYEDTQGDQLGFTDNDYKWTFINPRPFLAQTLTNTRVLTAGKHYTTCLPYALPQVDFKAYTLDASSSNLLGFKEVAGSLEALTPYVIIPEETGKLFSATEVTIPVTGRITGNQFAPFNDEEMAKFGNNVAPTVGGHQLLGTLRYMDQDEAAGMYIMQADKKWKKVGDATSTYNGPCILPMRAYIGEPAAVTPGGSRTIGAEFTNIDGTVISLDDVKFNEDDNVYDLQGRRVETPRKGNVYIINGKKQQWR